MALRAHEECLNLDPMRRLIHGHHSRCRPVAGSLCSSVIVRSQLLRGFDFDACLCCAVLCLMVVSEGRNPTKPSSAATSCSFSRGVGARAP